MGIEVHGATKTVYHRPGKKVNDGSFTAEEVIERNQLLRGLLGRGAAQC